MNTNNYYEEPYGVLQKLRDIGYGTTTWRLSIVLLMLLIRLFTAVPLWILVMVGELGHTLASVLGYRSRDW
jgi:hypothetical protein